MFPVGFGFCSGGHLLKYRQQVGPIPRWWSWYSIIIIIAANILHCVDTTAHTSGSDVRSHLQFPVTQYWQLPAGQHCDELFIYKEVLGQLPHQQGAGRRQGVHIPHLFVGGITSY